jgi:type IV conjugative transfer system lipoprotein TraV
MNKYLLGLVLVSGSMLGGCSQSFTCSQYPTTGCQPVSDVYDRTNGELNDYRTSLYREENKEKNEGKKEALKAAKVEIGGAYRALNYAQPGDPILSKPKVMRVLINSYVDSQNDLNAGGYIYIKVRDSEWQIN